MKPVSAVIITFNEEKNITSCIESLQWCDEIIVVDSHSTDNTVEIAQSLGATVILHTFEGYGKQKQFAIEHATHNWVLSIDADEIVTKELASEIQNSSLDVNVGYTIPRIEYFQGKRLRFNKGSGERFLRFFNKDKGHFTDSSVHEYVKISGSCGSLKQALLHNSYYNLRQYFDKFNNYTTLQAEEYYKRGKRTNAITIMIRFPLALLETLFFRAYLLDGYRGFLMGVLHSIYTTVKYAKLLELQRKQQ